MDREFERAYIITKKGDDTFVFPGAGLSIQDTTYNGSPVVALLLFTYHPDKNVFARLCKVTEETEDQIVFQDIKAYMEANIHIEYVVRPLSLKLWHKYSDYMPNYEANFHKVKSDSDVQNLILTDLSFQLDWWRSNHQIGTEDLK